MRKIVNMTVLTAPTKASESLVAKEMGTKKTQMTRIAHQTRRTPIQLMRRRTKTTLRGKKSNPI
jgi:hypothetical protein